jgi:L-lactate dehydrogenase complex protein LldE
MRIALFITCFNDALFPRTGAALVRVLEGLGHEVWFPPEQTCCGQIHFNTGYWKEARQLMTRFLRAFGDAEIVVAPSASCVAMVREQYPVLAAESGDPSLEPQIREVGARVHEMTELLVGKLGVEDVGASFRARVALHSTCHSIRGINVGDGPRRLLHHVRGLEHVDLPSPSECCGFGGTFAVKNPDTSMAMLTDKIQDIRDSGAEVLTAVDNSCLMHIAGGLRRRGWLKEAESSSPRGGRRLRESRDGNGAIRVMHLAEILATREGARA